MNRVAAIDIGTNSFLCLIAEGDKNQIHRILWEGYQIVRLGENVDSRREFSEEALARAELCFERFHNKISELKVSKIKAVATSASRDVSNGDRLIELGKKFNIPIEIISGDMEAQLTFRGVSSNPGSKNMVVDVGGGSTEIIYGSGNKFQLKNSFDVGSVRMTERFINQDPINKEHLEELIFYVRDHYTESPFLKNLKQEFDNLICVAGTPICLAAIIENIPPVTVPEGYRLELSQIENLIIKMSNMSLKERENLLGLEKKRADVIVAGSVVLAEAIRSLGRSWTYVSHKGLRFGLAKELF